MKNRHVFENELRDVSVFFVIGAAECKITQ